MSWIRVVNARIRGLFVQKRPERELDEEIRFHLEMQADDNVEAGMDPQEAQNAARRAFGTIEPMKETYREQLGFAIVGAIIWDIRYAVRTLLKSPTYTVTAVATLALAIGANTAMFSVLNAVLLRPLPYQAPEQLTMLWTESQVQGLAEERSAYWNFEQWRSQNHSFVDMALFDGLSATLTNADRTEKISVARVSPNLFKLLGVTPLHGRTFTGKEAEERQRLALIGYDFWRSHFGNSRDAMGKSIEIDGVPCEIIGILPEGFQLAGLDSDVWEPHTAFADWETYRQARGSGFWAVVGRLRPDVTIAQAQHEMSAIAQRLSEQMPAANRNLGVRVVPLSEHVTGPNARLALWLLMGAVFCVLLIAATNVASLTLARSASRERDVAVRSALGASKTRIARQLLAESLTLTMLSGTLGIAFAFALMRLILALKPGRLARLDEIGLDPQVLAWTLGICLFTGVAVGLAPALSLFRRSPHPGGREAGRSVTGGVSTSGMRRALVVAEFGLAIMLLVGAGLLLRSLWSVEQIDPGFRTERILSMQVSTTAFASEVQRASFYESVLEQVRLVPGVENVSIVSEVFIGGGPERLIAAEGEGDILLNRMALRSDEASKEFFSTLRIPLLRGRFFSAADGPHTPRVAIINDVMARRVWPGHDPIGRRFTFGTGGEGSEWFTVVGVVGNMRRQGLEHEAIPQMFEAITQNPSRLATLLVRTSGDDPLQMAKTVQATVRRVDNHVPLYDVSTLDRRMDTYITERRFQTSLLVGFAMIALVMAAIGIYGLIQYSIVTRTREIGIRMAMGAQAGVIFRMTLGEGMKLSLIGLALGLGASLWLSRVGSSLLFGVSPTDPLTFAMVSLVLTATAAAASYFPARRAMRVEPVAALRQE